MNTSKLTLPQEDLCLFADLYELTMAQAFFDRRMFGQATFSLFIRRYPPNRGYLISAGLEDVLDYLANFSFSQASLDYLRGTGIFTSNFVEYLSGVRFTGSVRAMPEGRLFFANEPVLEVTAPIIEAQLAETFIVNQINLQSLLATKAARCIWAVDGRVATDFGSRRTQGLDAGLKMARCGYMVGFQSTSNVLAAKRYGIPPSGTMAHSFISSFTSEIAAFRAYAETFPDRCILLLDTYDTIQGAYKGVKVAKELEARGHRLFAVRIDSGDFDTLSKKVRRIFDEAGLDYVRIVASGGLDEHQVADLIQGGAPIDIFGVGTKVGVSADAPWTDMAYKIVCYNNRPVMKLSTGKVSFPGAKQVYRLLGSDGAMAQDVIALGDEEAPEGEGLLTQVMKDGQPTNPHPSLTEIRERFRQEFEAFEDRFKTLVDPPLYPVTTSAALDRLTERVRTELVDD
jgi:nicotinate phosphoribosyltransferase